MSGDDEENSDLECYADGINRIFINGRLVSFLKKGDEE